MAPKRNRLVVALSVGFACSIFLPAWARAEEFREGKPIANTATDSVAVYSLREKFQTILVGNDEKLYAVEYYITTTSSKTPFGISLKKWVEPEKGISEFFSAWLNKEGLAKKLSENYQLFAEENSLLGVSDLCVKNPGVGKDNEDSSLCLNRQNNGGGFIYSDWQTNPPSSAVNRPDAEQFDNPNQTKEGLLYYWNGTDYYTMTGSTNNRIQAFGGCKVNTIDQNVPSNQLVGSENSVGERFCSYETKEITIGDDTIEIGVVSSDVFAPVFEGGTLETIENGQDFTQDFYISKKGGTIDNLGNDVTFSGDFTDHIPAASRGDLTFAGTGTTTFSGNNDYDGGTVVSAGTLKLGSSTALPKVSQTTVKAGATLDLNLQQIDVDSIVLDGGSGSGTLASMMADTAVLKNGLLSGDITSNGGLISTVMGSNANLTVKEGRTFLRDGVSLGSGSLKGGQLWAADDDTAVFRDFTLSTPTVKPVNPGTNQGLGAVVNPGLVVGLGSKKDWAMRIGVDANREDNGGKFVYESGNIYILTPVTTGSPDSYDGIWNVLDFSEADLSNAKYSQMFKNTYLLFVSPDGKDYQFVEFQADGTPVDPDQLTRDVSLIEGSLRIKVGAPNPDINLPDIVVPLPPDIVDPFPLLSVEQITDVIRRGLLPRNVDGAGQTLSTYNNLLTDTIFERTPMRQFTEVETVVEEVVVPDTEVVPEAEPVRGLWSKSGEIDDQQADEYLEQTVASSESESLVGDEAQSSRPLVLADAQPSGELKGDELMVEIDGKTYLEDGSLTAEYAGRDGVRGWFRGFGGQSSNSNGDSDTIYNPYNISAAGGVLGVDVSLSESFQLGAYANYGNINLSQFNGVQDLGGGWNADGWGGGVTADYWTNNFYVQGLLGATGFSGEQRRNIQGYGPLFDDQTAKGDKSATSMLGALRVGLPFQSGNTYIEPQLTATWTGNNEDRFSESTDDDRLALTYKSRNTNYLQTALGVKFAWPIKTGETGLFTPSVKLAWLGDWNQGNEDQTIGFDFTDKTYAVGSNQEDVNGALIEAGVDYNVAKIEGTTVKGYLRGGAELWGGDRGTKWRASGGVTFQF